MKRLILIILAALIAAATTTHAGWWKTFGGEGYDVGNCVQITSDGTYIISGAKDLNLWLLEVDTAGKIIWEHTYGKSDTWLWRWIEETSDGGFIIAPRTPSLLKVNAQGDSVWAKDHGINSHCVQPTSDGGFIFTGGFAELVLVKTDSLGDTIWTRRYTEVGFMYNIGYFIQVTDDGGYILTGLVAYADEYEGQWENLWLIKTDSLGNKMWSKIYGKQEDGYKSKGYCVRQTNDSGYIITGLSPARGVWLLKTDSSGDTLWSKTYRTGLGGEGYNVSLTNDGGYIIAGTTNEATLSLLQPSANRELWILKTDEQGDTLWTRIYGDGGEYDEIGFCVQQTSDSGYIIVGYTEAFGTGPADIYLLRTDSLGLLCVTENTTPQGKDNWHLVSALGDIVAIQYSDRPQGFQADVFDALGRKVGEVCSMGASGSIYWGDNQAPGVYFIQVKTNNRVRTAKVVLVK